MWHCLVNGIKLFFLLLEYLAKQWTKKLQNRSLTSVQADLDLLCQHHYSCTPQSLILRTLKEMPFENIVGEGGKTRCACETPIF